MGSFSHAQAIISAMITPALLILASGSLIAAALIRLARVVDRVRKLAEGEGGVAADELARSERRARLVEGSLGFYFAAVVCFVFAGIAIGIDRALGEQLAWLPVGITAIGMALITAGCGAMLAETRLSGEQLRAELVRLRDKR